jgi:hypothetical protein
MRSKKMRELLCNEVVSVSGGLSSSDVTYFMDKTVGYGATGVLANMVYSGVTVAAGWHGFLIGAGVGAAYAAVTLTAHSLQLW